MVELQQTTAFELLTFDGVFLLLPRDEVMSAELVDDVHPSDDNGSRIIVHEAEEYPVFSLNFELTILDDIPADHTACVCCKSKTDHSRFALSCTLAEPLFLGTSDVLQEVPEMMSNPESPVLMLLTRIFRHQQDLALVSTAEKMSRYLKSGGANNERGI